MQGADLKSLKRRTFRSVSKTALVIAAASYAYAASSAAPGGTVIAWGDNATQQITVPVPARKVVEIAARGAHSLALTADGEVLAWGDNSRGQVKVPAGFSEAIAIAAGGFHSLSLKSNGKVFAWGDNSFGQSFVPDGLTDVVAIAAGYNHSMALKANGTVVAWGSNGSGQATVPSGLKNVTAFAAGLFHNLALQFDGTVIAWGNNAFGQAIVLAGLANVVAIAGGGYHSLALKADGTVAAWGGNHLGQCSVPEGLKGVMAIAAGDFHSLAVKSDGTVIAWGNNAAGQTRVPQDLSLAVAVAGGTLHSLALIYEHTKEASVELQNKVEVVLAPGSTQATAPLVATDSSQTAKPGTESHQMITRSESLESPKIDLSHVETLVTSRASQASVDALAEQILAFKQPNLQPPLTDLPPRENLEALAIKLDAQEGLANSLGDLQLRASIERHLSEGTGRVALFYLPGAHGGQLEFVRGIVADTIFLHREAGLELGQAEAYHALGNEEFARKNYKAAYDFYTAAYHQMVR